MNKSKFTENLLLLIWTQALVATIGSLFYSELIGYVPCDLCWVQRIFMYPLVIIYGVAIVKKDMSTALSGLILSSIGFFISVYHYLLQKLPALQDAGGMCQIVPCNLQYVNYFGFITIPFLAGLAFLIISLLHIFILKQK
ncbi:MAG TPA: disulfide oxidoreductase [Bacillota bacterium]|nr:disulfide oxidoreductase [Bacillota bacterium]